MRRIIKSNRQPECFKEWKRFIRQSKRRTAKYTDLVRNHDQYLNVKRFLMREQYYLCCYCCNRIEENASHIEHFIPQSKDRTSTKQLDYHNIFVSCNGYINDISTVDGESCGHRRQKWYDRQLIISPLDPVCETAFEFLPNGNIMPHNNDPRAIAMIENFGLNSYALRKAREIAINTSFENIGLYSNNIDDEILRKEIYSNTNPNANGELPPFCDAVLYAIGRL